MSDSPGTVSGEVIEYDGTSDKEIAEQLAADDDFFTADPFAAKADDDKADDEKAAADEKEDKAEPKASTESDENDTNKASDNLQPADGGDATGKSADAPAQPADAGQKPQSDVDAITAERDLLRAQLALAQADRQKPPAKAASGAAAPQESATQQAAPSYSDLVPSPELATILNSEDPAERLQGLTYFIQATAARVHERVSRSMQEVMEARLNDVPATVRAQIEQANTARATFEDFYRTFPDLNQPEIWPVVQGVARQVMEEVGATEWSQQLRDAIGTRTLQVLRGVVAPASAPGAQQQQTTPAPAAQPFVVSPGSANDAVPLTGGTLDERRYAESNRLFGA